ncbi:MAG: Uma2 family endonuclease [Planctomycetaceae bacterium]|nr:Uma2 family endonuclease [Planctomycetaceae bacterium]
MSMRRFTVAEYERLAETGALTEDDSVELLEGLIVKKMTKNPLHDSTIDFLNQVLGQQLPLGWFLRIQNVLRTDDSEPEPDVVVTIGSLQQFRQRHPTGEEVALVIEVADLSLEQDWRKCRIYARAGVPEYWIVDLNGPCLEVFAQPNRATGKYESHVRRVAPEVVSVFLAPHAQLTVDLQELLPHAAK